MRFPGFEGDWEVKKMEEIGDFKNGINKSSEDFGFGVPFVNLMDIFGKSNINSNEKFSLVNANEKEISLYDLRKGDVLFIRSSVKRSGVGETAVILEDLIQTVYSGFLIRFRDNKLQLNINFKKYCFSTLRFRNSLISLSSTSANTNINQDSLSSLSIYFPCEKEQKKISDFLSVIDKRIQTQNKIIKELNVLKTTITKRIFSGEFRFKDATGKSFPVWKKTTLGELGEFSGGGTPSSSNTDFWNGDIPWISSSDLSENNIHSINITRFITESAISDSATKLCKAPLILIVSRVGVGKVAYSEIDLCTSQDFLTIYDFNGNGTFLTYLLSVEMKKIKSATQGTSIKGISSSEIKSKGILLPSIAEQNKIANFLSYIDSKIYIETQLLQKLEEQKKFLLQQMFV